MLITPLIILRMISIPTTYHSSGMNDRDSWTCDAMQKYGGSFVQALAQLARRSDPANLQKIKITFSEYWDQYEQKGKDMENRGETV